MGGAGGSPCGAAAAVRADHAPSPAPLTVRLIGEIGTIVWATGFRPDLSWLEVGVFDRKGRIVHDGGVTAAPGLYLMGLPFLRRRKSTLIDGAAADARELADHLRWDAPVTGIPLATRTRTRSTSTAATVDTSRSATGSTSASVPRWPGWKHVSP
jgi:hypothetical protein